MPSAVVMVSGTKAHADGLQGEVAAVLLPMGLRPSQEKTMTVHVDEGFDFLGFRIQRQAKRGTKKRYVYTWPSKKALASIKAKVKATTKMACRPARLTGCSAIASGGDRDHLGRPRIHRVHLNHDYVGAYA